MRQTTRWSTLLCRYQTAPESPSASNSFALCLLPHGVTLKSPIHVSLKLPRRCVQLDRSSIHRHGHRRHLHSPVHQFPITDYTFSKTSHAVYEGINKITTGSNHDSFNGGVARVNHTRLRVLRWWSKNMRTFVWDADLFMPSFPDGFPASPLRERPHTAVLILTV